MFSNFLGKTNDPDKTCKRPKATLTAVPSADLKLTVKVPMPLNCNMVVGLNFKM